MAMLQRVVLFSECSIAVASGVLQQKYGYAKDKAEKEYNDFIGRYK
jgi:hypothetical protein